jgi:hypothetical protein
MLTENMLNAESSFEIDDKKYVKTTIANIEKMIFWTWYFSGPIILLWWFTSEHPLSFNLITGVAGIVVLYSSVRLLILCLNFLLKKDIPTYLFLRPIISIVISICIFMKWAYAYDDLKGYMWQLANSLQSECFEKNSCLDLRPHWKSQWMDDKEGYSYKSYIYSSNLKWRISYRANEDSFELFMRTGLDGPSYSICGGRYFKPKRLDASCRTTAPKVKSDEAKAVRSCDKQLGMVVEPNNFIFNESSHSVFVS